MNQILAIAADEWRYWKRSRLAASVLLIGVILLAGAALLTGVRMSEAAHERAHLQTTAQETFLAQPDRHPHRMVHYGHYVFRTPPPLSIIDPGIDAYTGSAIFLEGHKQNTAMFSERQSGSSLAAFGSFTPAGLMQLLAPLLLILMGYNLITREREGRTLDQLLAQGASPGAILLGKGLALAAAAGVMLLPLVIGASIAVFNGGSALASATFVLGYAVYLLLWCALILFISSRMASRSASLGTSLALWVIIAMLIPPISSSTATGLVDSPGKIETDFAVLQAVKDLGDGHNAGDPAFTALRANLLLQYDVDSVEELPVNFRGVVAQAAEADLTRIFNEYAEAKMDREIVQAKAARLFGWLSPVLSLRQYSTTVAGVDLETHHRFLREAEDVRFDFVQGLNKVHAEQLAYADDIKRSSDAASEQRTRMSSENWNVLNDFQFVAAPANERFSASLASLAKLLTWLLGALLLCATVGRRSL